MTDIHSGGPAVVLIVEDEPLVRMMVVELFEDEGFAVVEAGNADQALVILEERQDVALLFTDVEMPGSIDGYALARWVGVNRPTMGIMIVSGRAMPKSGDIPSGATFLVKPYAHADVMRRVETLLSGSP